MPENFFKILRIHLIMRIEKDYSVIIKYIPFLKRIRDAVIIKNLFFLFISTVAALLLYINFKTTINQWIEVLVIAIITLLFVISVISGISSYKRTHFPVYQELLILAPLSNAEIYILLALEELIWFLVQSGGVFLTLFIWLYFLLDLPTMIYFLFILTLLAIISFVFLFSNRLWGMYQTYKIRNKIGYLRFAVYCISSIISIFIGYVLSNFVAGIILVLRSEFEGINRLLEDHYWLSVKEGILQIFNQTFNELDAVINQLYYLIISNSNLITFVVIFVVSIVCILLLFFYLYPDYNANKLLKSKNEFIDWLTIYVNLIDRIFNRKDQAMFKKELIILQRSRWIVSPGVFAITLYSLESFFYFGILLGIGLNATNQSMIIAILFLYNVLTMIIHCFEVCYEYPQVFFLGSEGKNIELLKSSPDGIRQLFNAKLKLLRAILIIPLVLNITGSIIFMSLTDTFSLKNILLLSLLLTQLYIISPLIQLYMSPVYSKFSYDDIQEVGNTRDEQELHVKFQSIPRYFILVPILVFSFLNIFFPVYILIPSIDVYYFIGFTLPMLIFWMIGTKIKNKGLDKLSRRQT